MATVSYNKIQAFVDQLGRAKHQLATDVLKLMLTNSAPLATNTVKGDLTDISAGNGYTAGGAAVTNTWNEASGTGTLGGSTVVWTASGGNIGPFRYLALYNDTQTSPAKPLIAWWDLGASVTILDGGTFTATITNLFTLA
jgi:hypothetical protein